MIRIETMQISKSDLKAVVLSAALVPALCLSGGVLIGVGITRHTNPFEISAATVAIARPAVSSAVVTPPVEESKPEPKNASVDTLSTTNADAPVAQQQITAEEPTAAVGERTEALDIARSALPVPSEANYLVQAGLFSSCRNATTLQKTLRTRGLMTSVLHTSENKALQYCVVLGSFYSARQAYLSQRRNSAHYKVDLCVARLKSPLLWSESIAAI